MLTSTTLSDRVNWPDVTEKIDEDDRLVYLTVSPTKLNLDPIYICMNEARTFIQQFGFGEWHYHPDEIDVAIEMARQLVEGEMCILQERDEADKYLGSGAVQPDAIMQSLNQNAHHFRRVFFNREPIIELIDYTLYIKGKLGWTSRAHRAATEKTYRDHGIEPPQW